jgi:hypothetical protein
MRLLDGRMNKREGGSLEHDYLEAGDGLKVVRIAGGDLVAKIEGGDTDQQGPRAE